MKREIKLQVTQGMFNGLSKNNMLFHNVMCELIDNSIASKVKNRQFEIEITIDKFSSNRLGIWICDNGEGMNFDQLSKALELGNEPDQTSDRLHEHGFGLKNALTTSTLVNNNGRINHLPWKIWTRRNNEQEVISVEGPFGPNMFIDDDSEFPERFRSPDYDGKVSNISTIIYFECETSFFKTVKSHGRSTDSVDKLKKWFIEHIMVIYRYYLNNDPTTYEAEGKIWVDGERVRPFDLQYIMYDTKRVNFEIILNGVVCKCEYVYGSIDKNSKDYIDEKKFLYYYLGNTSTQGIDVIINKRVIATRQLEEIFVTDEGDPLKRHNDYNHHIGEFRILDVPRGLLSTINNKTSIDTKDESWQSVIDEIRNYPPEKKTKGQTEKELREKWVKIIQAASPNDIVTTDREVWPTGEKIDVYRKNSTGKLDIHELKANTASLDDVYQLIKYCDGLEILHNERPDESHLIAKDFPSKVIESVHLINQTGRYNIQLKTLKELNLTD